VYRVEEGSLFGLSGLKMQYFQRSVRMARWRASSRICTKISFGQPAVSPRARPRRLRPCIAVGTWSPAASSKVGGKSTMLASSGATRFASKPGPRITMGMRIEASWQLRLYSGLRVRKWHPWSVVKTTMVLPSSF
jgi:hypothetical protein